MKVRLEKKRSAALDICEIELRSLDGGPLPGFTAGAHIDVKIADGMVRQYSLCNPPGETQCYRLGVLRDPASRGGSVAMHALDVGAELEISEPRNHFPLAADAQHSILLAGGIGVTPILSMAESLLASGASFEAHYCTREPGRTAFKERFTQPDLAGKTRIYHDSEGPRADLDAILAQPSTGTHVYVCGPAGFIEAVLARAAAAGWPQDRIHREYFGAATQAEDSGDADRPFQVQVKSTGHLYDVAADETIVAALARHGIDIQTSCEQGVCGTCLSRVAGGKPDHRDLYLTDEERAANDQILPCVSRCSSPVLVLDI